MSGIVRSRVPKYKPTRVNPLPLPSPILFKSWIQHPSPSHSSSSPGPIETLHIPTPRPQIPLTTSPLNHPLWNPDSAKTRDDSDESGRLARFSKRFEVDVGDMSALEGVTRQSTVMKEVEKVVAKPAAPAKKGKGKK